MTADGPAAYNKLQPGYFLETSNGLTMLDQRLQVVWFKPGQVQDLKQQTFDGKPVLTWWEGRIDSDGLGAGTLHVVNERYRPVATLQAARGWRLDMHEAVLSGHDAWVTAFRYLSNAPYGAGQRRGWLLDDAVQEYDLRNGRLLRNWDAFNPGRKPHVPPSDSEERQPPASQPDLAWDVYHANSIQLIGAHEFLVSMRNTSAAYLVDSRTGKIVWKLGGKHSSFRLSKRAKFEFQHHVALHPGGIVTMFDDRCCDVEPHRPAIPYGPSRGLTLKLNFKRHTASFVQQYQHQPALDSHALGSMQELANGNVLVGWGSEPYLTEYSRAGELLLDANLGAASYRVMQTSHWVGRPFYPPSAVVQTQGVNKTLYVSWNGATDVASWEVAIGSTGGKLTDVARRPSGGFETAVPLPAQSFTVLRATALDARGHALGSRTLTIS